MIDPSHLNKLDEFRSKIEDLNLKDEYLTRGFLYPFLKARNMDIIKAKEMLEKSIEFREENAKFGNWTPPQELSKLLKFQILGEDARGRPVVLFNTGKWEMKQVLKEYGRETYFNYYLHILFQMYNHAKESCLDEIPEAIQILDYKDFKMGQLMSAQVISATKEQTWCVDEYFPGFFAQAIVVRPTKFAESFIKLIRAFMTEDLRNVLKICSSEDVYKPELLKYLTLAQLPKELGGLRE